MKIEELNIQMKPKEFRTTSAKEMQVNQNQKTQRTEKTKRRKEQRSTCTESDEERHLTLQKEKSFFLNQVRSTISTRSTKQTKKGEGTASNKKQRTPPAFISPSDSFCLQIQSYKTYKNKRKQPLAPTYDRPKTTPFQ